MYWQINKDGYNRLYVAVNRQHWPGVGHMPIDHYHGDSGIGIMSLTSYLQEYDWTKEMLHNLYVALLNGQTLFFV